LESEKRARLFCNRDKKMAELSETEGIKIVVSYAEEELPL
jgi:hypothetical protein